MTGWRAVWGRLRRQQGTSQPAARPPCTCPYPERSSPPQWRPLFLHLPAPLWTCALSWSARRRQWRPGSIMRLRAAAAGAAASGGPTPLPVRSMRIRAAVAAASVSGRLRCRCLRSLPVMARQQRLYLGPDLDPDPSIDPRMPDPEADPWIHTAGAAGLWRMLTAGSGQGPDPDLTGSAGRMLAAGGARCPPLMEEAVSIMVSAPVMAASSTSGQLQQPQLVAVVAAVLLMTTIWSSATAAAAPSAAPAPTRQQPPPLPGGLRRHLVPEPGHAPPPVGSAQRFPPGSPLLFPPLPSLPSHHLARPAVRPPPRPPACHHYHMYYHHMLYRPDVQYRPHDPPVSPILGTGLSLRAVGLP